MSRSSRSRDLITRSSTEAGLIQPSAVSGSPTFREWSQARVGVRETERDSMPAVPWQGQPWVTPVLGSGPVGLPREFTDRAAWLPLVVGAEARRLTDSADLASYGADPYDFVVEFAGRLVRKRMDIRTETSGVVPADLAFSLDPSAVWLTLVAAQLTRTFHRMSLDAARPVSRWGSEEAEILSTDLRWIELEDEYLGLLELACREGSRSIAARQTAAGDDPLRPTLPALGRLLDKILTNVTNATTTRGVARRVIRLSHLEEITEAAWCLLVQSTVGSGVDPGWTNLLLQLALMQNSASDEFAGLFRPRWRELDALADKIAGIVEPATRRSWDRRHGVPVPGDDLWFYESVADVLWAQSAAVASLPLRIPEDFALPRPVAWVCSFDYELELALWRTAADRGEEMTFSVVMPVYVRAQAQQSLGFFVWVEGSVVVPADAADLSADEAFARVTTVRNWRLVTQGTTSVDQHRPVVVHLVGCPIVQLPDLASLDVEPDGMRIFKSELAGVIGVSEWRPDPAGTNPPLIHAVTVDEYLALRQTERDWVWASVEGDNHVLPKELFDVPDFSVERLWAVLGVPMRDPAIRLRLLSLLARGGVESLDRSTYEAGIDHRYGLAVNTRMDDEEFSLLTMLGFSVVKDRCENLAEGISDYGAWMRAYAARAAGVYAGGPPRREVRGVAPAPPEPSDENVEDEEEWT